MTYVLVHGGGFSGSCWDELRPFLAEKSYAVDLPGRGANPADLATLTVADWVTSVANEIVENGLNDVTLVGHSMAGLTLPGVAEKIPARLRRLVFISCAVPPHGIPLADVLGDFSPGGRELMDRARGGVTDGRGLLHPELAKVMFCNDMDEEMAADTLERRVPEAPGILSEPADLTGLRHPIPRTYVRLTLDASVSLEAQDRMIANMGKVEVVDLDAAHMAMISRPRDLAALLNSL